MEYAQARGLNAIWNRAESLVGDCNSSRTRALKVLCIHSGISLESIHRMAEGLLRSLQDNV